MSRRAPAGRLCHALHPDQSTDARCNRLIGHDGDHSGYGLAMRPHDWPAFDEPDDEDDRPAIDRTRETIVGTL